MRKQLYTSLLCFCLLVMMFVGSSLAWFTDDVYYVDVMTTGNIKIEQVVVEDSNRVLLPGVTYQKEVAIKNLGNIPCFVRTLVAFEDDDKGTVLQQISTMGGDDVDIKLDDQCARFKVTVKDGNEIISTTIYAVGVYTYNGVLSAGNSLVTVKNFTITSDAGNAWSEAVGGNYDMIVLSQATQATGWPMVNDNGIERATTAAKALDYAFAEVSSGTVAQWFAAVFAEKYADTGYTVTVEAYSASAETPDTNT